MMAEIALQEVLRAFPPHGIANRRVGTSLLNIKDRSVVSKDGVNEFLETPK
jgi:hypothetical protein